MYFYHHPPTPVSPQRIYSSAPCFSVSATCWSSRPSFCSLRHRVSCPPGGRVLPASFSSSACWCRRWGRPWACGSCLQRQKRVSKAQEEMQLYWKEATDEMRDEATTRQKGELTFCWWPDCRLFSASAPFFPGQGRSRLFRPSRRFLHPLRGEKITHLRSKTVKPLLFRLTITAAANPANLTGLRVE